MKNRFFKGFPVVWVMLACLGWHCDLSSSSVPTADADPCLEDSDCRDGYSCQAGYCIPDHSDVPDDDESDEIADNDETIDVADQDDDSDSADDHTEIDTDDDPEEGNPANTCIALGGTCQPEGSCPDGTVADAESLGCESGTVCCFPAGARPCRDSGGYCEPPVALDCYRDGYHRSQDVVGECGDYNGYCCVPDTECLGEGQTGIKGTDLCCFNLIEVEGTYPLATDSQDDCKPGCENCFYCSRCGNGICGDAENYCNCPEDCPEPFDYCRSVQDCAKEECYINSSDQCVQVTPKCEEYECTSTMQAFEDHLCLDGQCTPRICQPGDTVMHTCWDGEQVMACECLAGGGWRCEDDPNALCADEPVCGLEQVTYYSCPHDNRRIGECFCEVEGSPYCSESEPEGWRPAGTSDYVLEASCKDCRAVCRHVGSYSEGWYDSCSGEVIAWGNCSAEWYCKDDPWKSCSEPDLSCAEAQGTCRQGRCEDDEYNESSFACDSGYCCIPIVFGECMRTGGYCTAEDETCELPYSSILTKSGCSEEKSRCCVCPYEDCSQPTQCEDREDCPDSHCRDIRPENWPEEGTWVCEEINFHCTSGSCEAQFQSLENYYCDSEENRCVSMENSCERSRYGYGHCEESIDLCRLGEFAGAIESGCEDPNPVCCQPKYCSRDAECPDLGCSMEGNICISYRSGCGQNLCHYLSVENPGHVCTEDGQCVVFPEPNCEQAGGTCIGWGPECSETQYNSELSCDYGQCCMPQELGDCHQLGGTCTDPEIECPDGTYAHEHADSCSYYRDKCCLPEESSCPLDITQCSQPRCEHFRLDGQLYCREFQPACRLGQCAENETLTTDKYCASGECYEGPDYCRAIGGYCVQGDECPGIRTSAITEEPVCGEGAVCCSGYGSYWGNTGCPPYGNYDLLEPFCYNTIENTCVGFSPFCVPDMPPSWRLVIASSEYEQFDCIDGECVAPNTCVEQGGLCYDANDVCPAEWVEMENADCGDEGGTCCTPLIPSECEEAGGFCASVNESYTLVNVTSNYDCNEPDQVCTEVESYSRCWGLGGFQVFSSVMFDCPPDFVKSCDSEHDCCCLAYPPECTDNDYCSIWPNCRMDETTGKCIETRGHCLYGECQFEEKSLTGYQCMENGFCQEQP